jgi:hypothetical protein
MPSILSVVTPKPVLNSETLSAVERFCIGVETSLQVFWMNTLSPSLSNLRF